MRSANRACTTSTASSRLRRMRSALRTSAGRRRGTPTADHSQLPPWMPTGVHAPVLRLPSTGQFAAVAHERPSSRTAGARVPPQCRVAQSALSRTRCPAAPAWPRASTRTPRIGADVPRSAARAPRANAGQCDSVPGSERRSRAASQMPLAHSSSREALLAELARCRPATQAVGTSRSARTARRGRTTSFGAHGCVGRSRRTRGCRRSRADAAMPVAQSPAAAQRAERRRRGSIERATPSQPSVIAAPICASTAWPVPVLVSSNRMPRYGRLDGERERQRLPVRRRDGARCARRAVAVDVDVRARPRVLVDVRRQVERECTCRRCELTGVSCSIAMSVPTSSTPESPSFQVGDALDGAALDLPCAQRIAAPQIEAGSRVTLAAVGGAHLRRGGDARTESGMRLAWDLSSVGSRARGVTAARRGCRRSGP